MSLSTSATSTDNIINAVYIWGGLTIAISGCIGHSLNLIVFLSLRTFREISCSLYLILMSIANIGEILLIVLPRMAVSVYGTDETGLSHYSQILSMTSFCLVTIDQYCATSHYQILQRFCKIRIAQNLILLFAVIWFIHGLPYIIYFIHTINPTAGKITCTGTDPIYLKYPAYAIKNDKNILKALSSRSHVSNIRHLHKRDVSAPIQLYAQSGSIHSIWNTNVGGDSLQAREDTSGIGFYAIGQSAENLFDNNFNTAYTSRGNASCENSQVAGINTGFYFNVAQCQAELTGFQFCTSTNADRSQDPLDVSIEGSNNDGDLTAGSNWQLIYLGKTGLDNITTAETCGVLQEVTPLMSYKSYRFLITSKRNLSNYVSYSEIKLFGYRDGNFHMVNVNSFDITVVKNVRIDYAAIYTCDMSTVTVTTLNMSTVDNLCSINQLNVNAYDNSTVTLKSSSCPNTINIFANTSAVVNNICANDQAYLVTKQASKINFNPSIKCSNIVNAKFSDYSKINNICANNELNIVSTEQSVTNMNLSLVYPKTINVTTFATSRILNIFANETMYIQAKEASYITTKLSPCPKTVSVTATGGHVYNLCASNYANLYASYGSKVVMQNSSCPLVADASVEYGGNIYVCATQAINAIAQTGGTIYYRGILNSSSTSTSGQIIPM